MRRAPLARSGMLLAALCWLIAGAASAAPLATVAPSTGTPAPPRGAGLVVRHGDGRVVYVFVPFDEPSISGSDLLQRSHLALVESSYAGLGVAICSLDNEGCPASNCFCKSYGQPSIYWHLYTLGPGGQWAPSALGPSSLKIQNGDVEGWTWGAGDTQLPQTSVAEIARLNGLLPVATPVEATASATQAVAPVAVISSPGSTAEARAVEVAPNGTTRPVQPAPRGAGPSPQTLALFGGLVVLVLLTGGVAMLRRARRAP